MRLYQIHYKVDKVEKSVAENDLQVKKAIGENTARLTKFCHHFLDSILAALPTVPYGIRWITRQLLLRVDAQFPHAKERDKSILVGGFMFLRYFSPAILSPETNGVIETTITETQRRNLTLITKVLQNLANDLFFQGKEAYMMPMTGYDFYPIFSLEHCLFLENLIQFSRIIKKNTRFLKITKPALDSYFLSLGNVPPPEKQLGISSQHFHAEGREILLSESDLYFLFNALKVCKDKLISDNNDPMKPLLAELGVTPAPNNTNKTPIILFVTNNSDEETESSELNQVLSEFFSKTSVQSSEGESFLTILETMVKQSNETDPKEVTELGYKGLALMKEQNPAEVLDSLLKCISSAFFTKIERS